MRSIGLSCNYKIITCSEKMLRKWKGHDKDLKMQTIKCQINTGLCTRRPVLSYSGFTWMEFEMDWTTQSVRQWSQHVRQSISVWLVGTRIDEHTVDYMVSGDPPWGVLECLQCILVHRHRHLHQWLLGPYSTHNIECIASIEHIWNQTHSKGGKNPP